MTPGAVHRYFEVSLFLLVTVGFLALASTGKLDVFSLVAVTAALVTKALRYRRHHGPELSPGRVTALTWFYFFFYGVDLFFLAGPFPTSFLVATTHLVLFIAVVKLFSARSNRDYLWLALIAFMEILAAATLTVDTTYLAFFFLFLVLGISTFISYEVKRGGENAQTAPLPVGSTAARRLERSLLTTSVVVAVTTLLLSGVLFFLLPRVGTGYMSAYGWQPEQIAGFTNEVTLGDIGAIKLNPAVVMRVRASGGNPQALEGLKWRGVALTRFDGHRWYTEFNRLRARLRPVQDRFRVPLERFRDPPFEGVRTSETVSYRMLLEPISGATLFVAMVPLELQGRFRGLWMDEDGALTYFQAGYVQSGYDVVSAITPPAPAVLRAAGTDYPAELSAIYVQVPPLDPRIAELARSLTTTFDNPYDKARELERYFRTQFGYTLELPQQPQRDPIAHFLFERRRGHCEYFAASMTVMLRGLGIPARMVNGFLTGEYNEVGENYIVRAQDAHTWVEVYFPGTGWVEFDPTPPDPNPRRHTWWTSAQHYLDAFDLWWDEWVINYDELRQFQLARDLRDRLRAAGDSRAWWREKRRQATTFVHELGDRVMDSPLALPAAMVLLAGVLLVWRWRRLAAWLRAWRLVRGGGARGLSAAEATLVYQRLLAVLRRRGFRKTPGQTPLEFAASLSTAELADAVSEFTRVYNRVRFGMGEHLGPQLIGLLRQVEGWRPGRAAR